MAVLMDPKYWTKSYVRENTEECIAYIKRACINAEKCFCERRYVWAVQELDNFLNGMVVFYNVIPQDGKRVTSSSISFMSAVEAMIFLDDKAVELIEQTLGKTAGIVDRKKTIRALLLDAKDFSNSSSMKELYSNALYALEKGCSFASVMEEIAPDYPEEAYFCFNKVIEHL